MADLRKFGSTSNLIRFMLKHATTGQGLTGLTNTSSGLIISTICDNEASPTAYTVAASNVESITTLGTFAAPSAGKCRFAEVNATNHPGLYEFQFADARFAVTGAKRLVISAKGATNLLDALYEIQFGGIANSVPILGTNTGGLTIQGGVRFENANGTAFQCVATGSNGNGVDITGNGTGNGANISGQIAAYLTGLHGLYCESSGGFGAAFLSTGEFGLGVAIVNTSEGKAMAISGELGGVEVLATGASGPAVKFQASGTGKDLHLAGDAKITGSLTGSVGSVTGLTNATIADAVWDEATSGHTSTDTFGEQAKTDIDAIKAKTDNLPGSPAAVGSAMTLTSGERDAVAAALLDLADSIESTITVRKALRAIAAVVVGLLPTGAGTGTEAFKGIMQAAGGTTRVTNTVDPQGNRTAQTLNL